MTPLNGLLITKNGTVFFFPDYRFIKYDMQDLERLSINFVRWKNNKYSVTIKFILKNGEVLIKDYSKQFRNMKNRKLAMSIYTIAKSRVDGICLELLDLDICDITIVDNNGKIAYQNKQTYY